MKPFPIDLSPIDNDPTNDEGAAVISSDYYEAIADNGGFDDFEGLVDAANE